MIALPKTVWTLWLQGWDNAPDVAQACLASWRRLNPGWDIRALDAVSLRNALPAETIAAILSDESEAEARSDRIRIELLSRHAGVWADATAMCARPLDDWLHDQLNTGFFAFERPTPDRMIASWFLAATSQSHVISAWRDRVAAYWQGRQKPDDYFWFHSLFGELYESDSAFRVIWDATPKMSAVHAFHFAPNDRRLLEPPTSGYLASLNDPPEPVFKLTRKLPESRADGALIDLLRHFGRGELSQ